MRTVSILILAVICSAALAQPFPKPCDLMKLLLSEDDEQGQKGIDGFVSMGPMASVPLVCFISGKAPGCTNPSMLGKTRGEKALVTLGGAAVPAILERLASPDEEFRTRLVRVIGQIKDVRREAPLKQMWTKEKSDRVRAELVGAIASFTRPDKLPTLLVPRIAQARLVELEALAAQFALLGGASHLRDVLSRVSPENREKFLAAVTARLKACTAEKSRPALALLQSL